MNGHLLTFCDECSLDDRAALFGTSQGTPGLRELASL